MTRKFTALGFILLLLISSCENEDICLQEVTPFVIITFYDKDNPEEKKAVESLSISSEDFGEYIQNRSTDSIAIPMNLNLSETPYLFLSGENQDDLTFNYNRESEYISRSCGFKTTFKEFSLDLSNPNWISSFEILNTDIIDESSTAIKIYH
jgi:hypothetical protein